MMNDQETNDLIWASSHYLCESLPNNFRKWSEKKLEPETAGKMVGGKLKQHVQDEAEDLHLIQRTSKLPI